MKLKWWIVGLLIALAVTLISPLASAWPDGLERVAEDKGFIKDAQGAPYEVIPDYVFPGVGNEATATILAGIVGTLMVFGLAYGLGALLKRRETT
jgi:hypothetical protein